MRNERHVSLRGGRSRRGVQVAAAGVDNVSVAVEHGRQLAPAPGGVFGGAGNAGNGAGRREEVARVEKAHVVARGAGQALVHGVVKPAVGLAGYGDGMAVGCGVRPPLVVFGQAYRAVGRRPVYYDVLYGGVALCQHRL